MEQLGERLKQLRLEYGMTQLEIANRIGVTATSVQRIEYGSARPSLDTLIRFALCFNVSLDYLVGLSQRKSLSSDGNNLSKKQLRLLQYLGELSDADADLLILLAKRLGA